jgi:hypothetical protein
MTGGFMLNKIVSVRVDDLWLSWLARLAREADKTPAEFVRDMVYSLILAEDTGQAFCEAIKSEQISYTN